jgi:hypothetical protein
MDWNVILHPSCTADTISLATELGFTVLDTIEDTVSDQNDEATTCFIMPHAEAHLDGYILKATMMGLPVVSADWLLSWKEQKVWKNEHPQYEHYLVHLVHTSAGMPVEENLDLPEKAREAVRHLPLKDLKFMWKQPNEEESVDYIDCMLGLRSATVLAGGKVVEWPATKAKTPKRGLASYILVLPSPQEYHQWVPEYLQNLKWTTYESLITAIVTGSTEKCVYDPVEAVEREKYHLGTVPDSQDETESMDVGGGGLSLVLEKDEEEEVAMKPAHVKAGKVAKSKQSANLSPLSRGRRSKRKVEAEAEEVEEVEEEEEEKKEESKGKRQKNSSKTTSAAAAVTAEDSPAPLKRQRTRGAAGAGASQEDSLVVESPGSVHPSPPKKGRKATTATTKAAPAVDEAPAEPDTEPELELEAVPEEADEAPPVEKTKTTKTKSPAKAAKSSKSRVSPIKPTKKTGDRAAAALPAGDGWKSVAKKHNTSDAPNAAAAGAGATIGEAGPSNAAPAAAPAETAILPVNNVNNANTTAAVEEKQEHIKTSAVDASAIIVDAKLIVNNHDQDGYGADAATRGDGGFKKFRHKGSIAGYGGTARLPRIPFDPEPYREGQGYKDEEYLQEEADKEAALEAADMLFNANLKPKRDKKVVEEEKKMLLSMLPEAARRRLEK